MIEEDCDPVILLEANTFIDSYFKDSNVSIWLDSLLDVWDFVWVDTEEEEARTAETLLSVDTHAILNDGGADFADSVINPIIWVTSKKVDEYDHAWCEDRNKRLPTLYVEVDPTKGITRQDVELATAFIGYIGD